MGIVIWIPSFVGAVGLESIGIFSARNWPVRPVLGRCLIARLTQRDIAQVPPLRGYRLSASR